MICRECQQEKAPLDFRSGKRVCKSCQYKIQRAKEVYRRACAFPGKFMQCNDCEFLLFKYRNNGGIYNRNKEVSITKCKNCGGSNIGQFKGFNNE